MFLPQIQCFKLYKMIYITNKNVEVKRLAIENLMQ